MKYSSNCSARLSPSYSLSLSTTYPHAQRPRTTSFFLLSYLFLKISYCCCLHIIISNLFLSFSYYYFLCRPDLVDWRSLKNRGIRDRLESAFNIVEREYGVTRLLDPEGKLMPHTHTYTHRHYRVKCNAKVKIGGGGTKRKPFREKICFENKRKEKKKGTHNS